MTALVRSASLTRFAEVALDCGLDPRALVAEVGLPRACLDDPDLMIPAQSAGRLLELAAARGNEPAFGLRMAESRRLSNLGPLGLMLRDQPTLRDALEAIAAHMPLHNEALRVQVEQWSGLVSLRMRLEAGNAPQRQAMELVLGVTFRFLRIFLGSEWRPRLVCLTHAAPPRLALHRRVFGDAVELGHEFNGIVCNAADLDAPNPAADPVMARYTRQILAAPGRRDGVADRVREFIVILLPRRHCSVELVAQHLGVDRRTVARRLAAEGTSFSALVDGVRCSLLANYLEDDTRPLGEIAALLGFSELSAFSRWHRQRFGAAARERRVSS